MGLIEDSGRPGNLVSKYLAWAPPGVTLIDNCGGDKRCPNRWADGDTGNGISGPPAGSFRLINNNNSPNGGPVDCPWSTNNCGPNDEPFSYHTGGVMAMFGDGSVHFISEAIDTHIVRRLANRSDGEVVDISSIAN